MTPNRLRNLSIGALVQNAAQNNLDSSNLDENLAADFDGSFSGLGVDMNAGTSNYSMSDALMALPNISISTSQIFKHEAIRHRLFFSLLGVFPPFWGHHLL